MCWKSLPLLVIDIISIYNVIIGDCLDRLRSHRHQLTKHIVISALKIRRKTYGHVTVAWCNPSITLAAVTAAYSSIDNLVFFIADLMSISGTILPGNVHTVFYAGRNYDNTEIWYFVGIKIELSCCSITLPNKARLRRKVKIFEQFIVFAIKHISVIPHS